MRFSASELVPEYSEASRAKVLTIAGVLSVFVAIADLIWLPNISLGFLYIFPILLASAFLKAWQIALYAFVCAVLREFLGPLPPSPETPLRVLFAWAAFVAIGLFVLEVSRRRRMMSAHVTELQEQIALRREAQEQLTILIETSPAAILILDQTGTAVLANESAARVLGRTREELQGQNIYKYLPALATVPAVQTRALRTNLECRGHRANGSIFLAQVWFSTYSTSSGPRMAAILLDASEGLRDREGAGLMSLMRTSRILIGAVSHSVRNLCAASRVCYANLGRLDGAIRSEDYKALGTVISGLESIASMELNRVSERPSTTVDLNTLLDELRIMIEPALEESDIDLQWRVPDNLPSVLGEHYGLLHAFLNIVQNSERALANSAEKQISLMVDVIEDNTIVRLADTGGGVTHPERLFQAFDGGASGTGLGLYVSRAIVRSFEGDLRYEALPNGSCFVLELAPAYNVRRHAEAAT